MRFDFVARAAPDKRPRAARAAGAATRVAREPAALLSSPDSSLARPAPSPHPQRPGQRPALLSRTAGLVCACVPSGLDRWVPRLRVAPCARRRGAPPETPKRMLSSSHGPAQCDGTRTQPNDLTYARSIDRHTYSQPQRRKTSKLPSKMSCAEAHKPSSGKAIQMPLATTTIP